MIVKKNDLDGREKKRNEIAERSDDVILQIIQTN